MRRGVDFVHRRGRNTPIPNHGRHRPRVDGTPPRFYNPPPKFGRNDTDNFLMAHHKSAEKRIRQTPKRTLRNRARTSGIKTAVKKAETALAAGEKTAAEALKAAQSEMARGVQKGLMHRNTVARKISRLTKRLKALG
jgi:small subunit ribosomal protein S20